MEKIKEAYGEYWDEVKTSIDENGWCKLNVSQKEPINNFAHHGKTEWMPIDGKVCWRPKSLQGIEDNNGWTKINSEDDLHLVIDTYWVIDSFGCVELFNYCGKNDSSYILWKTRFTHYQKIIKPKPPLY